MKIPPLDGFIPPDLSPNEVASLSEKLHAQQTALIRELREQLLPLQKQLRQSTGGDEGPEVLARDLFLTQQERDRARAEAAQWRGMYERLLADHHNACESLRYYTDAAKVTGPLPNYVLLTKDK